MTERNKMKEMKKKFSIGNDSSDYKEKNWSLLDILIGYSQCSLIGDPKICIGDPPIFIGHPQFLLNPTNFSPETPNFLLSIENPTIIPERPTEGSA